MMDVMKVAAVLRRAAENAGCGLHEVVSGGGECPEGSCNGCREASAAWANEAADAIERCALPEGMEWPAVGGRKVDFKTAYAPGLGVLEAVCIYNNGACEVMSHDGIRKPVSEIRLVVLAADGEPLEAGQTVWSLKSYEEYELTEVGERHSYGTNAADHCRYRIENEYITHQRPVLDADGVPIHEGDTVYLLPGEWCGEYPLRYYSAGDEMVVKELYSDHEYEGVLKCAGDGKCACFPLPCQLTHAKPEPPDSRQAVVNEIGDEMAARIDLLVSSGRWSDAD